MQASAWTLLCRLYTDTCVHAHTWHVQPIVHSQPKASAMDATAVPHAHLRINLYLLGPTDNADPPTSPQIRPFPQKRLKAFRPSAMCCCPSFFLFHRRALRFLPIRCKVRQTRRTVPRACRVKRFGPRTQLCRRSSELPELGSQSKSLPN